ncbi:MAG: leucine-rich repeat domain-containing protein [Verrucomicrobia bacterium]|nr:leucine-rich repeat domain-containing protein [Verrucomicrobiota bacterium]
MYQAAQASRISPRCDCLQLHEDHNGLKELRELHFHTEIQNKECDAWKLMETLVEKAIEEKSKEFSPGLEMPPEMWSQIITLPPSIARLKSVRKLYLYGSHLVRIPVEIGEMTDLEEFDAYTSYRLHWLPYEITRCQKLKRSRMSTRALYGNYKYRPPFPRLPAHCVKLDDPIGCCSVCGQKLLDDVAQQVWISLKVATDVLPLLVNACSEACIQRLPSPEKGYVNQPHKGGLELQQPSTRF